MSAAPKSVDSNDKLDKEAPPKMEVALQLKGVCQFNQYPSHKESNSFLFMAGVKAPFFKASDRAAIDLCCVVDESGSMEGERMKLVKETLTFIVEHLEAQDRFGIVGYHSDARVVLSLSNMTEDGKKDALKKVNELRPQGFTALCDGLCLGIDMMRKRDSKNANPVSSIMLFTDGQANEGYTNAPDICRAMRDPEFAKKGSVNGSGNGPFAQMFQQNVYQQQMPMQFQQMAPQMQQMAMPQMQQPMRQQMQIPQLQQQVGVQQQQIQGAMSTNNSNSNNNSNSTSSNDKSNDKNSDKKDKNGQNDKMDEKEEKKKEIEKGKVNERVDLPCTVNTFGFGADHKASLLEAIAESGRGMYVFIENKDMIAESFAECLGGLVSIIAKNIELKVSPMNGVKINKCLSKGYEIIKEESKNDDKSSVQSYTIKFYDIQSEEERDIIFDISLPKLNEEKAQWPYMQLSCKYSNIVKKTENEMLSVICKMDRVKSDETGERNDELDVQYNRIQAANAMEDANRLASEGKLDKARTLLTNTSKNIASSKSGKSEYASNLINDMNRCVNNLKSQSQWQAQGSKMLSMNAQAQQQQRSVQSSNWGSQMAFANKSKAYYKASFKK